MTNTKEPDIIKIADIFWAFHNARLADPSLREMKPYVEPILQLINEARIEELEFIDKLRRAESSIGAAIPLRIASLKSTKDKE